MCRKIGAAFNQVWLLWINLEHVCILTNEADLCYQIYHPALHSGLFRKHSLIVFRHFPGEVATWVYEAPQKPCVISAKSFVAVLNQDVIAPKTDLVT